MKCRPLRIAVVLLVVTAITSNIVGGTLAKYKVVDSSNDSAHVAKWGITVFADGNLFGKNYYGNPSNTISTSDDGRTITVKSVHNASIDNLVAPGTKNDVGLTFGISGKAETAVKVDVKIRDRSVVLRPNVYYIMHKLTDVTQDNFAVYQERYGGLYVADGESYILADTYAGDQNYYAVDNMTQLNTGGNWSYCPVVFEIVPTDGIHGLEVTKNGIKA
ncbi:MAG: hypothetical protein MJ236_04655, partial [Clostridia bacterium]|nr:hypothetical protein [Clostridia bacterium]